jgi:S1-C subfamily serine protease
MKRLILVFLSLSLGIVGGVIALKLFSFNYIEEYLLRADTSDLIPIEVTEIREIVIKENESIVNMIEKTERAIVGIRTKTKSGVIQGSGLIVSSDGLLVTLNQIIPIGGDFSFLINGEDVSYEIIKRDNIKNLVLIKLNEANLPTLDFRDLDNLKTGEKVFMVGKIFDEKGDMKKSINEGIVKRFDSHIRTNIFEEKNFLGSTLFDIEGKVLGLNLIDQRGEIYSIPIFEIREFVGF